MNSYTLGRMGVHNVVNAVMPEIDDDNATTSSDTAAERLQIHQARFVGIDQGDIHPFLLITPPTLA